MAKPSAEMIEVLRGIQTEIGAGMVLFPKSDAERAHNNACERANSIIANCIEGYGLFQMTKARLGGALAPSIDPDNALGSETPTGPQMAGESGSKTGRSTRRARSKKKDL
jgi:hypothetical protein